MVNDGQDGAFQPCDRNAQLGQPIEPELELGPNVSNASAALATSREALQSADTVRFQADARALRTGRLMVVAAAVLWSISGVATKAIDLDPWTIAFFRGACAGLVLLPLVPRQGRVVRPAMLPMILCFGAMSGLYLAAIKATTAANAIFLQCSATFWLIPIGYVLLGEKPDPRALAGIGLAMAGVVTIVAASVVQGTGDLVGIALGIGSGVAYAGVVVSLRSFRGLDPLWLSSVNNLGGALVILAAVWLIQGPIAWPSPAMLVALTTFGVVQMAIPYVLFARGLRVVPAAEGALLALLEPILSPFWVFLFIGEQPDGFSLIGGACLLGGIVLRYLPLPRWSERRRGGVERIEPQSRT